MGERHAGYTITVAVWDGHMTWPLAHGWPLSRCHCLLFLADVAFQLLLVPRSHTNADAGDVDRRRDSLFFVNYSDGWVAIAKRDTVHPVVLSTSTVLHFFP